LEKVAEFKENIGDYRDEAEILEKLHKIDSKNPIVIKKLATAYEKLKNKDKALEYYNKFISASPVNEDYEQIKSKINKLQNTEMEQDEGLLDKIMGFFNKK
jgi:tetratricopeptide (TPR) repeat protein